MVATRPFDAMTEALQRGEGIEIRGYGSFTVRPYKPYAGRNPYRPTRAGTAKRQCLQGRQRLERACWSPVVTRRSPAATRATTTWTTEQHACLGRHAKLGCSLGSAGCC